MEAYGNETCTGIVIRDDCGYEYEMIVSSWISGRTAEIVKETGLQFQVHHDSDVNYTIYYHPKFSFDKDDLNCLIDVLASYMGCNEIPGPNLCHIDWDSEQERYVPKYLIDFRITGLNPETARNAIVIPDIKIPELKVPEIRVPEIRIPEEPFNRTIESFKED